jgi:hypothetical protein
MRLARPMFWACAGSTPGLEQALDLRLGLVESL